MPTRRRHRGLARIGAGICCLAFAACTSEKPSTGPTAASSVTVGGASVVASLPVPATRPLPPTIAASLQAVLASSVNAQVRFPDAANAAPGVTAAIISDKGAWSGAAGVDRTGAKLNPHAMFAIASISKTFTAAEVMVQAAAGRVDLDAPLSRYLGHRLARNNATVRQALGMRSGLPDFTDTENNRLIHAMAAACSSHWTPTRTLSYARGAATTADSRTVYSNPNYLLLALLLKQATGHDAAQLYRTDLFTPAGLDRIAAQDHEAPAAPVALPAASIHRSPGDPYIPCRAIASGFADTVGGLAADAPTIARWGYELYGARVLPPRTVKTMLTPLSDDEIFPNVKYGLGTEVFHVAFGPDDSFGHIGSQPGYSTMVAVTPARHLAAAVFIAADNKNPYQIMKDLHAELP